MYSAQGDFVCNEDSNEDTIDVSSSEELLVYMYENLVNSCIDLSNKILIKRSGTANSVPVAGDLSLGELAINYNDGNLFYKNSGGTVTLLTSNQFVSVAGNVTGGNIRTGGVISATGNVTVGNISATIGAFTTFTSAQGGNVTGTLIATSANAQFKEERV
jgi:hypothetical protein